ncbi:MAG: hypothetical protein BWK79_16270 [Beggiatoa sp. IS2]|nr:MAG: hypothetical protein BWK79_16270 [Beggiatoa sp. IS2]
MSILEQKSFVAATPPFNKLTPSELDLAAEAMDIAYFKKGERLIRQNSYPEFLYIVIKGIVHEVLDQDVISLYLPQDSFDAKSLIEETKNEHEFIVHEELICYLLPKSVFLSLIDKNSDFRGFYSQTLSERLNAVIEQRHSKELASFMVAKLDQAYVHPPRFVSAETSIYEAVQLLEQHKLTCLLVKREDEVGIVTDTDIRRNVVLERRSVDSSVGDIATYNLISIRAGDFLFNALILMTKHSVKRLVVCQNQEIMGVLDQMDLLSFFSNHSHLIAAQIERATNQHQLKIASQNIISVVQSLYARGVKIRYITQLVNELNRKVFEKLYSLIAPPELIANSCLVVMGSEGRAEQILKTDQDNAIILKDGYAYPGLGKITQELSEILLDFGYPRCPGNIMVSNPYWCKPLKDFQEEIYDWIENPKEDSLMNLAVFYDSSPVAGDETLLQTAKTYLFQQLQDKKPYFTRFSKPVVSFETPLGWFANFIVDSEHKNQLDIKKGAIFPIMHGVRSLALEYRLTATNTIERIKALSNKGLFNKEFSVDLIETFAFVNGIRLHLELEKAKKGGDYDNYIDPRQLTKLERDLLKDSLKIVNEFKKFIIYHYRLNMVT